ncbi:class I SAM-dependent methyltransferase [Candidatus Uhrbacteria bacterium]|nr:class I SAM-dependent methyltransferase [Candidatus Uhrbacteria bacterium]
MLPAVLFPQKIWNRVWYAVGALALPLNALRHGLQGYTRPRGIDPREIREAIEYDWEVVARWRATLNERFPGFDIRSKHILELGPGPDLGVGLILLGLGAASYAAIDRHPLAAATPQQFYDELKSSIMARIPEADESRLTPNNVRYIVRNDFSFTEVNGRSIDLIVSNAAFEHFDDPADVIKRLTPLASPGCVFVADIDLQTHSRILRDRDPLSIYRYGSRWYRLWKFIGSPNRVRPSQFSHALASNGWKTISMDARIVLDPQTVEAVRPFLAAPYTDPTAQIEILDFMLTAQI